MSDFLKVPHKMAMDEKRRLFLRGVVELIMVMFLRDKLNASEQLRIWRIYLL